MPYSHSLAGALVWSAAAGLLAVGFGRQQAAPWIALAVFSHFVLDVPMHTPDMPILGDSSPKIGLGLWRHRDLALAAELIALGIGIWIWRQAPTLKPWPRTRTIAFVTLLILLTLATPFLPPPRDGMDFAWQALGGTSCWRLRPGGSTAPPLHRRSRSVGPPKADPTYHTNPKRAPRTLTDAATQADQIRDARALDGEQTAPGGLTMGRRGGKNFQCWRAPCLPAHRPQRTLRMEKRTGETNGPIRRRANRVDRAPDREHRPRRVLHPDVPGLDSRMDGVGDRQEVSDVAHCADDARGQRRHRTGGTARPRSGARAASSAANRSSCAIRSSCRISSASGRASSPSPRITRSARRSPPACTPRSSDPRASRSTRCMRGGCSTRFARAVSSTPSPSSSADPAPGRLRKPAAKRSSASTPW